MTCAAGNLVLFEKRQRLHLKDMHKWEEAGTARLKGKTVGRGGCVSKVPVRYRIGLLVRSGGVRSGEPS